MNNVSTKTSYLIGLVFLLSGILYFFASNWQGMERSEKILLSVGLMLLFYLTSFIVSKSISRHVFLSHWTFLSGATSFGISIALLGQVYNSHADSYMLFIIWLIPVFLFSLITGYQPFYVMSLILLNLSIWFYLNPSSHTIYRTEGEMALLFLGFAILNLLVFLVTQKHWVASKLLEYLSFLAAQGFLFTATFLEFFPGFKILSFLLYLGFLAAGFVYFKKKEEKVLLVFTCLIGAAFLFAEFIDFSFTYMPELFYLLGFAITVALLAGSVFFVRWISKYESPDNKFIPFIKKIVTVTITIVASLIGMSSTLGVVFLATGLLENGIYMFGMVYIIIALFVKERIYTVKYTLLVIGFMISGGTAIVSGEWWHVLILAAVSLYVYLTVSSTIIRVFMYILLNLLLLTEFVKVTDAVEEALIIFAVLNIICYLFTKNILLKRSSYIVALALAFSLSFVDSSHQIFYYLYNAAFIVIALAALYRANQKDDHFERWGSGIFLTLYIGYKYYDMLWSLIHKSVTFTIIGILFLTIATYLDRASDKGQERKLSFVSRKASLLIGVVLLQMAFLSVQVFKSESILKNGKEITVSLVPVDPRSMLQGDYVILRYSFSTIPELSENGEYSQEIPDGDVVSVLLRENGNGIYQYGGNFAHDGKWMDPYEKQEGDVIIDGRYDAYNSVTYGIENFFIPEGKGSEYEGRKFAELKVGSNGDAILTRLIR
ncbi:GDYXXLXY domain-containing protein [Peribacillus sp. SCS-155]|uniref:GDYXXLXY domain-containing protein n=1 Tax=Peribacillus sedimenti TaxID=3115297 RepID=UPI003905C8D3